MTYVDTLLQDTGLENISELQTAMMDKVCWKGCVFNAGRPERRPRIRRSVSLKKKKKN